MNHDLINTIDFASLPQDPHQRFLTLERICRRRVSELITSETGDHYDEAVRVQYMNIVAAAAEELGVDGVRINYDNNSIRSQFEEFIGLVTYQSTKLNLRTTAGSDKETVLLANATRAKIELQIRRLREMILSSDLPDKRKSGLVKRLDDLSIEVVQPRPRFAVVMAVIAAVGVAASESTSFLADAPDAIMTISRLLGVDKEAEEAEQLRLGAPPAVKALPAPTEHRSIRRPAFEPGGLDDDIPF